MPSHLWRWSLALVFLVSASVATAAEPGAVAFSKRTTIAFASAERGRELITRRDDFIDALSTFDLQSRLKTDKDVVTDDLLQRYRDNVTDWPAEDAAAVTRALEFVRDRLRDFDLPLPEVVYLVRTTGKEEADAAYCRGPTIVLPVKQLRHGEADLQRLIAHELFHVLSSHDAELRRDLYATIGFTLCEPISPPKSLAHRTIANPDAPRIDCIMKLAVDGAEPVTVAPILIASADKFDPAAGKTMFDYLQFRLMVVEAHEGGWRAAESDGAPRLIDPRGVDDFWKQIGRNTKYIIHPDEILADNFVHLVMQTEKLPTPEIVAKMRERLLGK